MKTKKQIKERIETVQRLADEFYKDWQEKSDVIAFRIHRQYTDEVRALEWVLEN